MIFDYYQAELDKIKQLAREFSKEYPALAPLLREQSTDPDVERLLEGVAFLTSQIQISLDNNLLGMLDDLTQLFFPQHARPLPSTSIIQFLPKKNLAEAINVHKGTELASIPINGIQSVFCTTADIQVEPVIIESVEFRESVQGVSVVQINCNLCGVSLRNWRGDYLRFFIKQRWEDACNTFYVFHRLIRRIILQAEKEEDYIVPLENWFPTTLYQNEPLYPLSLWENDPHSVLHEYINQPYKFLFFTLKGLNDWPKKGESIKFKICLELTEMPPWFKPLEVSNLILHAVPIINLFSYEAEPIFLDHRKPEYRIIPANTSEHPYEIFQIDKVVGYRQQEKRQIEYENVLNFNDQFNLNNKYTLHYRPGIRNNTQDIYIGFFYDFETAHPFDETISIQLTCTNGDLPSLLDEGDITQYTDTSPENLTFTNVIPPSSNVPRLLHQRDLIWKLQSLLAINFIHLLDKNILQEIFNLYTYEKGESYQVNMSRIQGIEIILVERTQRLYFNEMIPGTQVTAICKPDHYKSVGDMYLFGCILNVFFGQNAPANSFTMFQLENSKTKEVWKWMPWLNNPSR
ncbi:TPA: type VI secretion system baseplate subunit TssF [Legionella pneumophila]|nr:type VI secretion system baseplate subunit TssF [Legionella pneumophila]HAT2137535.1 type VI secretion system baseplate subunit TssF [Legionella pneumophila]HAT2143647.1 type VI secretion system baseplate subunit TssF [Legionella pneumophila]HAT2146798.1 type VI secretion system baseplate subunit TssF [Legionella pneumophila]HAT2161915.1 type VI secretion system baseplate subunit TssF [Legionella pneumophila]